VKKSELTKIIQEAIHSSLKETNSLEDFDSSYSDADELAYADHLADLASGVSDNHMREVETLLMRICEKFKKIQTTLDPEVIAQAIQQLEQIDGLLGEVPLEEGFEHDRQLLISQVQLLGKKIAGRASFSKISNGSMATMVSNLEAIANKLN
jgi:hypothetical protein